MALKTFIVKQYELHVASYAVTAEDECEAIRKVINDEAAYVDGSRQFVTLDNTRGMRATTRMLNTEPAISVDGIVPSIGSIEAV